MELTKSERKLMTEIIRRGILRRCEEWLLETKQLIEKSYNDENAFDRCMEVTKRSRNFFKEAMQREEYYKTSQMLTGASVLLAEGYLSEDDL